MMDFNSLDIQWTTTVMGQEGKCREYPGAKFRKDSKGQIFIDESLDDLEGLDEEDRSAARNVKPNLAINAEALARYTRMQRERLAEIDAELYGSEKRALDPAYYTRP